MRLWPKEPWPKDLPRFPAFLLWPAVTGALYLQCRIPQFDGDMYVGYGWPLRAHGPQWPQSWAPQASPNLLIDLTLGMVSGYILAIAVDRLLFPMIRGVRRRKLGQREAN